MRIAQIALGLSIVWAFSACSSKKDFGSERTIEGRLDTSEFRLKNARVFAYSQPGAITSAPVAADGRFSITVRVPGVYSIRFANSTNSGAADAFAVLNLASARGYTQRLELAPGETLSLGRVHRLNFAKTTRGLGGDDDDDDDSEGDSDDDDDSDSDDGDSDSTDADSDSDSDGDDGDDTAVCDLGQNDMTAVVAENDPAALVDADGDGVPEAVDPQDNRPMCTDGGDDDVDSDSDADSDSDTDAASGAPDNDADSDADTDSDTDADSDSDSDGDSDATGDCAPDEDGDDPMDGVCPPRGGDAPPGGDMPGGDMPGGDMPGGDPNGGTDPNDPNGGTPDPNGGGAPSGGAPSDGVAGDVPPGGACSLTAECVASAYCDERGLCVAL